MFLKQILKKIGIKYPLDEETIVLLAITIPTIKTINEMTDATKRTMLRSPAFIKML